MKEYTKKSAMRLALIWSMGLLTPVFLAITYRIATKEILDYSGIAILVASLTAFIGALVTGKYLQKKEETK